MAKTNCNRVDCNQLKDYILDTCKEHIICFGVKSWLIISKVFGDKWKAIEENKKILTRKLKKDNIIVFELGVSMTMYCQISQDVYRDTNKRYSHFSRTDQ